MKDLSEASSYRALVDTSSVVAHDVSAQLHVLQFCIEELGPHISDGGADYLSQLKKSSFYLSSLLNSFRKQLRISFDPKQDATFFEINEAAKEVVKNHYYGFIDKLVFREDITLKEFRAAGAPFEVMHQLYSLYALFIDALEERNFFEEETFFFNVKIKKINKRFAVFLLETEGHFFEDDFLWSAFNDEAPDRGKMRKLIGLNLIEKERKEDSEKIRFFKNKSGICIEVLFALPKCESDQ